MFLINISPLPSAPLKSLPSPPKGPFGLRIMRGGEGI